MMALWWKVFINDSEISLSDKGCINKLSFSNPINGSDTVTIGMSDPDMIFIEDNIYVNNAPAKVQWGVHDTLFNKEFNGYISAVDIDFPIDGIPTLQLTVMDKSHIMNRDKKKRSWENTTNAVVVQSIAREYGFKCIVESGYSFKTEETISQDNVTDIEFLEKLADDEDEQFYCKLIGDTIYYCKKGLLENPVVSLKYRQYPYDLLSFKPQITIEDKKTETETSDIDTDKVETVSSSANESTAVREVQGSTTANTSNNSKNSTNSDKPTSKKKVFNPKTQQWETK